MKYLDFEKHIKNELKDSKETVQMDALLASLNLGKKKPNRKGFALWMFLPFLLLTISIGTWKLMESGNQLSPDSYSIQKSSNTTTTEVETYQNKLDNSNLDNSKIAVANQEYDKTGGDINEETNLSNVNQIDIKHILSAPLKSTFNSSSSADEKNSVNLNNEKQGLNSNLSNETINQSYLNSSYLQRKESTPGAITIEDKASTIFESTALEPMASRSILSITDLNNAIDALTENEMDESLFSRMKINCPSFDNSGWHIALIPEVGIFRPFKTLENTSPEESAAFNERIKSEGTLEGLEVGLYGMLVRDHVPLYLKVGVSYSRISERMNLDYEYTELDTTIGIISTTISGNGDTITHIYGDIVTETTFKGSNRQHHYIHLFDLPISVGYSTYLGGLDIGIEAGIKVNFMTRATGNLLTSQKDYTNLSLNKLFKNRVGISYFGGLMIGRNFGRFGDIYIAPRFTYYPNSFNNQNNSISQKYFNIGLNAGVVYKIN